MQMLAISVSRERDEGVLKVCRRNYFRIVDKKSFLGGFAGYSISYRYISDGIIE